MPWTTSFHDKLAKYKKQQTIDIEFPKIKTLIQSLLYYIDKQRILFNFRTIELNLKQHLNSYSSLAHLIQILNSSFGPLTGTALTTIFVTDIFNIFFVLQMLNDFKNQSENFAALIWWQIFSKSILMCIPVINEQCIVEVSSYTILLIF